MSLKYIGPVLNITLASGVLNWVLVQEKMYYMPLLEDSREEKGKL